MTTVSWSWLWGGGGSRGRRVVTGIVDLISVFLRLFVFPRKIEETMQFEGNQN